jgi:hypothetical protein
MQTIPPKILVSLCLIKASLSVSYQRFFLQTKAGKVPQKSIEKKSPLKSHFFLFSFSICKSPVKGATNLYQNIYHQIILAPTI